MSVVPRSARARTVIYTIEQSCGIVHTGIHGGQYTTCRKDRATFTLKDFPAWKVREDVPTCFWCVVQMRGPWS